MHAIFFEQAFNEQCRICLKLADLFTLIDQGLKIPSVVNCRLALESLLHAVALLDRPDFKSKLVKELTRLCAIFHRLVHSTQVNQHKLMPILTSLENLSEQLQFTEGKVGQHLRSNDFLNAIRAQQYSPGGICLSDIPLYQLWLQQPEHERQSDLQAFFDDFSVMQQTVAILLTVIRDSALFTSKIAERGFYQMSLDAQQPLQLLRIQLPAQTLFFPETSIGRHGVSIRFYPLKTREKRRTQTEQDIAFKLSICAL